MQKTTKLLAVLPILLFLTPVAAAFASGPTQQIPPNPCSGGTLVLTINYHVINDEDSGFVGYWALDHYSKTVQVYLVSTGTNINNYCAWETYDGGWQTFAGALSPQAGITESRTGAGNFNGYLELLFTGTLKTSGTVNLSTKNYGGTSSDIILGSYGAGQKGPTSVYSWTNNFVTGFAGGAEPIWGFFYYQGNSLGWTNAPTSSGDIIV